MKLKDKLRIDKEINADIFIGICLGIIGNALFQWYYNKMQEYWGIIIVLGIVLLILIFNKKSNKTSHYKQIIPSLIHLRDKEILNIISSIRKVTKDEWCNVYKGSVETKEKSFLCFFLEKRLIFKITISEVSIQIEYYACVESEYIMEKIMNILNELKNDDNKKLFHKKQINELRKYSSVYGEIEN